MIHTDRRFSEAVEQTVTGIETKTDAEVVIVAAERSGSYRDVAFIAASVAALFILLILLYIPQPVAPHFVVVDTIIGWFSVAWAAQTRPMTRLLSTARRRQQQVRAAAELEFHRESVHGTRHRIGVLVYVSALEGLVEVIPDVGIEERIPNGRWVTALDAFSHDDLDHFLIGLDLVGTLLAEHIPVTNADLIDLPNSPRVRP